MNEKQLADLLDRQFTVFFGKICRYFDKRMEEKLDPIRLSLDRIYTMLDTHEKRIQTEEIERLALSAQVDRHERAIAQMRKNR